MNRSKKGSEFSKGDQVKKKWKSLDSQGSLTTKEKLEKLIQLNLKRSQGLEKQVSLPQIEIIPDAFTIKEFHYPLETHFKQVVLKQWESVSSHDLAVLSGDDSFQNVDPEKILFFDVETTGLAGGTGTIPFMLGFGFFDSGLFRVKVFILNDLNREEELLGKVDEFLGDREFSATVTYNGKAFDFPLMETRYILNRKRFPLLKKPHMDFLFPARTLWKYTYESRKLGYLGEIILGISRQEDVEGSQIPALYFNYLRTNQFSLLEKVVEHNALDLVGLSALMLQGISYMKDISNTQDEGEVLGTALLFEKSGDLNKANELLEVAKECARREPVIFKAVKHLSILKKKEKCYEEATALWEILSGLKDHFAFRELSIHFEHREKDYYGALEFVHRAIEEIELTDLQRQDLEKRLRRLQNKIQKLEDQEE
jgi:uncharacterized protein YprB with RNaseH-like and TPR domain